MSTNAARILVIEDERPIRRFLRATIGGEGHRFEEAETGEQGIRLAAQQPPDLVVLDLGLPDMDGLEVLRRLREWLTAPILILSARDQDTQKVAALDAGADDYLTKPFSTPELLARIRAALRRSARDGSDIESPTRAIGDIKVDLDARKVHVSGREVHLTPIEYRLFLTLVKNAGKVLTHRYLLREVWGTQAVDEVHNLRVFMASLRRKIETDPARPRHLRTEQGVGYRLVE